MTMKTLFILRHAKSSWAQPGVADIERPLNGRGRKQCEMLQSWMQQQGIAPARVVASISARTRETVARIAPALGEASIDYVEAIYAGSVDTYLSEIWATKVESLLLVGHNPTCDELVRYLATPGSLEATTLAVQGYPTSALSILKFDGAWSALGRSSAELTNFVTAKSLETT
ncbi:phosphohistidine phosphatase, SixA [Ahrensia sp. R2A130]|nr:phosphohistidine phosphatase, SixA [Ahrensia sp. R2A130]